MLRETAPRLIGRDRDVAAVTDALVRSLRDEVRLASLVTVVGPIGVGKSALARRVAAELSARGVFDAVIRLDAAALPGGAAPDSRRGAGSSTLVVLDGCDDGAAAPSIARALEVDPAATLLATARSALRIDGEIVVELAPLPTPAADAPESPAFDCLAAYLPEGAARTWSASERAALAALLRELDGLPLALALAAPRLALMDPAALLHRLRASRSVLQRPGATEAERRPFEAALSSAVQALEPRARAGLAALTSVVGSAPLDALEAIVGPPQASGEARAIDVVDALRARGLLVAAPIEGGGPRLAMLRCVRDMVVRTAPPADVEGGRERHAAYFADRAEGLRRAGGEDARRAIALERDDLVAVLERVVAAPTLTPAWVDRALRILVAVYADPGTSPPSPLLPIIDAAVDRTKDSGADPGLVAQALVVRARARRAAGDAKGATRDLLRALQVALPARRRDVEAEALATLAHLFADRAELEAAVDHARRASLAHRDAGDRRSEIVAAAHVADLERRRGRLREARDAIDRAIPLAVSERSGPPFEVLAAAIRLQLDAADDRALQAIVASARGGSQAAVREAELLLVEGVALHDRGEIVAARERYAEADAAAAKEDAPRVAAEIALFDGVATLAIGRRGDALARLRTASELGGSGLVASAVAELGRSASYAIDAWLAPDWCGARPADGTARLARELARRAESGGSVDGLGDVLAEDGDDRVFARLFARAIEARIGAPPSAREAADIARFDVDGRWFRLPSEPVVTLERRRPIASMLKLLVAERLARPGAAVSVERLLAAGWPGERVQADAGAHRVRVALSTLRKLGLRAMLLTTADGYALDREARITAAESAG